MAKADQDYRNETQDKSTREIVLWLMLFNAGFVFGFLLEAYLLLMR